MNTFKEETTQLLNEFYGMFTRELPSPFMRQNWKPANKRGFFLGIILYGNKDHVERLYTLLKDDQFESQQKCSTDSQLFNPTHLQTFIDEMFCYYIQPFQQDYSSSCHTPTATYDSIPNSADYLDRVPEEAELIKSAKGRDKCCLFCWDTRQLHAARIVDESSHLVRAGLEQKHQVQNGLYLCNKCHGDFNMLNVYVDVVDGKWVVKFVNKTDDPTDERHLEWMSAVATTRATRVTQKELFWFNDSRLPVEPNGEMALYFVNNDPMRLPSKVALEFHKIACLILRMAGGLLSEEEVCPDDFNGSSC